MTESLVSGALAGEVAGVPAEPGAEVVRLLVNGTVRELAVDPRASLLEVLRESLGLIGTKNGCGEGECGACTVLLDGRARCACLTPVGAIGTVGTVGTVAEVTTVEGLRGDPVGECLFAAFDRAGAVQCGFCTPGFVVAARSVLAAGPEACADAASVADRLAGNLCRCTGYAPILAAVQLAGRRMRADATLARLGSVGVPAGSVEVAPDSVGVPARPVAGGSVGGPARPVAGGSRFLVPGTVAQACAELARLGPRALPIAGGTHVMVDGGPAASDAVLVWLGGVAELGAIEQRPGQLRIGAAVSWARLRDDAAVARLLPALAQAAARVGGPQVQEAGTLGGNLVNASPGADGAPALAIHGAELELRSATGTRRVPVAEFALAPGRTVLAPGEILTAVLVPVPARPPTVRLEFFVKVGPRRGRAVIDKVMVACAALYDGHRLTDVRIALGAAGPTVLLATEAARLLMAGPVDADRIAAAGAAATAVAVPVDDIRPTAAYRGRLVGGVLVRELSDRLGIEFRPSARRGDGELPTIRGDASRGAGDRVPGGG
ncbi:MAG TPA: FAD binding domain-containing protein [Pseudonocardia sp.]|nr:FAD binding domain-containing protein [Pseudonocardia sp.]